MNQKILVAVDIVVLRKEQEDYSVLLIGRKNEPFKDQWALPGGFVEDDEKLLHAAKRELKEETGIDLNELQLVGIFDDPDRDPRSRVISIAFYGTLDHKQEARASSDAKHVKWIKLDNLPELAFDHFSIIRKTKGLI